MVFGKICLFATPLLSEGIECKACCPVICKCMGSYADFLCNSNLSSLILGNTYKPKNPHKLQNISNIFSLQCLITNAVSWTGNVSKVSKKYDLMSSNISSKKLQQPNFWQNYFATIQTTFGFLATNVSAAASS